LAANSTTGNNLGISVPPSEVRLITGPQAPYKWAFLPEKRYLFQKHLSKHCMRAYKEIYRGVGEAFEAVPTNASSEARASAMVMEALPENPSGLEAVAKPTGSFTAKIDELMGQILTLTTELEQSRLAASQAEMLNRELEASLEAAQLNMNALQEENERIKEACHRNTQVANFFRAKAVQLDAVIKEISSTVESAKAKVPIVCPDP
jgi:hypothetical protein